MPAPVWFTIAIEAEATGLPILSFTEPLMDTVFCADKNAAQNNNGKHKRKPFFNKSLSLIG